MAEGDDNSAQFNAAKAAAKAAKAEQNAKNKAEKAEQKAKKAEEKAKLKAEKAEKKAAKKAQLLKDAEHLDKLGKPFLDKLQHDMGGELSFSERMALKSLVHANPFNKRMGGMIAAQAENAGLKGVSPELGQRMGKHAAAIANVALAPPEKRQKAIYRLLKKVKPEDREALYGALNQVQGNNNSRDIHDIKKLDMEKVAAFGQKMNTAGSSNGFADFSQQVYNTRASAGMPMNTPRGQRGTPYKSNDPYIHASNLLATRTKGLSSQQLNVMQRALSKIPENELKDLVAAAQRGDPSQLQIAIVKQLDILQRQQGVSPETIAAIKMALEADIRQTLNSGTPPPTFGQFAGLNQKSSSDQPYQAGHGPFDGLGSGAQVGSVFEAMKESELKRKLGEPNDGTNPLTSDGESNDNSDSPSASRRPSNKH